MQKLLDYLKEHYNDYVKPTKVYGMVDDYVSDAGTWWPGTETTIAEIDTVDWELLLEGIEKFEKEFK